jgi:hypothetical protein
MSVQKNIDWLRHRTEQYQSNTNDMCEVIKDFEDVENLGQISSSTDCHTRFKYEPGAPTCTSQYIHEVMLSMVINI